MKLLIMSLLLTSIAHAQTYELVSSVVVPTPAAPSWVTTTLYLNTTGQVINYNWNHTAYSHFHVWGSTEPCPWSTLFSSIATNNWNDPLAGSIYLADGEILKIKCLFDLRSGQERWSKLPAGGKGEAELHERNLSMQVYEGQYDLLIFG